MGWAGRGEKETATPTGRATTGAPHSKSTCRYKPAGIRRKRRMRPPGQSETAYVHADGTAVRTDKTTLAKNSEAGDRPPASSFCGAEASFALHAVIDKNIGPAVARRSVAARHAQIEFAATHLQTLALGIARGRKSRGGKSRPAVSYTHLTLPTREPV